MQQDAHRAVGHREIALKGKMLRQILQDRQSLVLRDRQQDVPRGRQEPVLKDR